MRALVKTLAVIAMATTLASPALAGATKEKDGNRAHCDIHTLSKKVLGKRFTTGEKLHCTLYLTEKTKTALIDGGGAAAGAAACTALGAAIIAAGGGPEDVIADALAAAAGGVCEASLVTAAVVLGESCKGGMDMVVDGKAEAVPPKGHVAIKPHACR